MRRRLFVAAEIGDVARTACAHVAERLRAKGWPGRWVAPENYHLTVAFLGGVDEERVAEVIAAVRGAAVGEGAVEVPDAGLRGAGARGAGLSYSVLSDAGPRGGAFDVPLDMVGAFPNARKPRVAWVGPAVAVPAFGKLCAAVRTPLAALGFTFEPHDDAHVTLARSEGCVVLPAVEPPRVPPQRIASLTLYESFTARTGARYEAIERFGLS